MGNRYASGKNAIAVCDRCGFRYKLKELKELYVKNRAINQFVCKSCWEPSQPQLELGSFPVSDAIAVYKPRPDHFRTDGSRIIQWGWAPVGLADPFNVQPNALVGYGDLGSVTVIV